MALDFNADEIFEMAEQIEKNGAIFYRKAAKNVSGEEKDFLLELAKMEDDHEVTFKALRKELTGLQKESTTFDPNNEAPLYLKALADSRVFFEKELDPSTMKDILKAAIGAEKDSIVFYLGMKDIVPAKLGKEKIDGIIKEEMSHIKLLSTRLINQY
ncbi:MAG: ferritin family protein [Proteobacteria bacterium]|nr:ferritin family protein [Pseudomonadota bacterium]